MAQINDRINAIRLSDRQYCQLQAIRDHPRSIVKIEELQTYNQLTLGGNKRRNFIKETPDKNGVVLTQEGWAALEQFSHADFLRKISSTSFSSFLSLDIEERPTRHSQKQRVPYPKAGKSSKGRRRAA